ncbi:MAG: hypothetical protein J6J13_06510 [Clostridia bacterium]|nr:hypothetical protein [Clostridia bacterium]
MSNAEYITLCTQYQELKRMKEEITAEMDGIADQIKTAMGTAETVTAGQYKIRHTTVNGSRLDSAALKKALPDIAARFTVATVQKRFSIN